MELNADSQEANVTMVQGVPSVPTSSGGAKKLIGIGIVVLLVALGYWWWQRSSQVPTTATSINASASEALLRGAVRKTFGGISLLVPPSQTVQKGNLSDTANFPQAINSWIVGDAQVIALLLKPASVGFVTREDGIALRNQLTKGWAINIVESRNPQQGDLDTVVSEMTSGPYGKRPSSRESRTVGKRKIEVLSYTSGGDVMGVTMYAFLIEPKGNIIFIISYESTQSPARQQIDAIVNSVQ